MIPRASSGSTATQHYSPPAMARPPAPGSVIVPDWHESAEGKEYLACILRKNRRRVFGECTLPPPTLGRTVSLVHPGGQIDEGVGGMRACSITLCCLGVLWQFYPCSPYPQITLELIPPTEPGTWKHPKPCQELLSIS